MVGRIGTYAATQVSLSNITSLQQQMYKAQLQINTGLKTQNYSGLGTDVSRVMSFQSTTIRLETYIRENTMADVRLEVGNDSITAVENTMKDFNRLLLSMKQTGTTDEHQVREIQEFAMKSMIQLQGILGVDVDGQYIFGGSVSDSTPVVLPYNDLESFQEFYDGIYNQYPDNSDANLQDVTTRPSDTGQFTYNDADGTITAANPNAFDNIAVGSQITMGGGASGEDPVTYTVKAMSADGQTIRVAPLVVSATNPLLAPDADNPEPGPVHFKIGEGDDSTLLIPDTNVTFNGKTITIAAPVAPDTLDLAEWQQLMGEVVDVKNTTNLADIDGVVKNNDDKYDITGVVQNADGSISLTVSGNNVPEVEQTYNPGVNPAIWTPPTSSETTGTFTPAAGIVGVTVGGTVNINNVSYEVQGIDVATGTLTVQESATTLNSTSWYRGDDVNVEHRVDDNIRIDVGLYASDPAIEKAIRALGIIAQGEYGTAGGLENNIERVDEAAKLIENLLDSPSDIEGEEPGDMVTLLRQIGFTRSQLHETINLQQNQNVTLLNNIDNLTKIDKAEAIVNLTLAETALNASYESSSIINNLSLLDYIR